MKPKCFLMFLALLLSFAFHNEVMAQRCLVFRYDADGNRIKRIVNNDCYAMKEMEEVPEVFGYDEIEVYPNPTFGVFHLFIPAETRSKTATYELFDTSGLLMLGSQLYADETEIDIGDLPAGVYVLKIINGDDVLSKMILKY